MKVEFLAKFLKDIDKLKLAEVKESVINTIEILEAADSLADIPNLKKLKGHKFAFRIKIGDYRIGVFIEGKTVELARFVHRKDIYKVFP